MKILIAEDNPTLQELNAELMDIWEYDFDMVCNGMEAVEYAKKQEGEYDLCLMDIDMPIMNGIQASQVIRQKFKYFPIMAYSANPSHMEKCFEIGMDGFLEKPCCPDLLLDKINELTVKIFKLEFEGNDFYFKKEMPMDRQHAQELRELAKKDLRKVKLFDSPGSTIIVHKNVTNKISHDFNIKKQFVSTFTNRDPERPTRCELYKDSNYLMPQTFLTGEECDEVLKAEDQDLEKYSDLVLKEEK